MPQTKTQKTTEKAKKQSAVETSDETVSSEETVKQRKPIEVDAYKQMVHFLQNMINDIEMDLKRAKLILDQLVIYDHKKPQSLDAFVAKENLMPTQGLESYEEDDAQVVEGLFDGYFMIGNDQKKYPVPLNYSSKTKLVPGDVLKLKIMADGKFVYKLIRPAERLHCKAILSKTEENKYIAITEDRKTYFLNQAAVTFFKGKPGDELYVVINSDGSGGFAALEAVIKK